jgi:hypothetical protein
LCFVLLFEGTHCMLKDDILLPKRFRLVCFGTLQQFFLYDVDCAEMSI